MRRRDAKYKDLGNKGYKGNIRFSLPDSSMVWKQGLAGDNIKNKEEELAWWFKSDDDDDDVKKEAG